MQLAFSDYPIQPDRLYGTLGVMTGDISRVLEVLKEVLVAPEELAKGTLGFCKESEYSILFAVEKSHDSIMDSIEASVVSVLFQGSNPMNPQLYAQVFNFDLDMQVKCFSGIIDLPVKQYNIQRDINTTHAELQSKLLTHRLSKVAKTVSEKLTDEVVYEKREDGEYTFEELSEYAESYQADELVDAQLQQETILNELREMSEEQSTNP